ncbi:MAG: S8 family peptidase [Actinobacteria bacterium]|nr:S8 family peptidase [Actinomycetota bacterium]
MRRHRTVAAPWGAVILAMAVGTLGVPTARGAVQAQSGPRRYVVLLKDARADAKAVSDVQARKFGFKVAGLFDRGLRGYVGSMSDSAARALAAAPGVAAVAPDTKLTASDSPKTTQDVRSHPLYGTAPVPDVWGLDRIDQRSRTLDHMYSYDMSGTGVTAYIVDTGVLSEHVEFALPGGGSRVSPAGRRFDAYRDPSAADYGEDCDGHGTHVAGTLGGQTFGVAKNVSIVSVRVLDCDGSGYISDIVNGINWMIGDHAAGTAAVANMSFGGGTNNAIDVAVNAAIKDGITVAIAAGNNGGNACNTSPARVAAAITVGATDSNDRKASWSNYGSCLDVFAPGVNIVSSYGGNGGAHDWAQMSGTSMATPHVAGVAALLLSSVPGATPSQVSSALASVSTTGAVTSSGTSNPKLLYATSDLVSGQLPSGGGTPNPTVTSMPTTTTRQTTTTTTRPCSFFCFPRR